MPWIRANYSLPARYCLPTFVHNYDFDSDDITYAFNRMESWRLARVVSLQDKAKCSGSNEFILKFFKDEAVNALRNQRAWQYVIDHIIGETGTPANKDIAALVDWAFSSVVNRVRTTNVAI